MELFYGKADMIMEFPCYSQGFRHKRCNNGELIRDFIYSPKPITNPFPAGGFSVCVVCGPNAPNEDFVVVGEQRYFESEEQYINDVLNSI